MRRSLAALAAAVLLMSTVGGAIGAEPDASATPAPIVEPTTPPEPPPSADPVAPDPSTDPVAPDPSTDPVAPDPSTDPVAPDPSVAPSDPDLDPGPALADPDAPVDVPAVPATMVPGAPGKGHSADAADPTDRWIVVLKSGTDAAAAADRQGKRIGFRSDRTFRNVLRGYSAKLDRAKVAALSHDSSVEMIVADERIEIESQAVPNGIIRIGAIRSPVANINRIDDRVDADVAIVDTGITPVADLNVVGGYNCSTSNRALWRDVHGHGTHVAGTVGAIDNASGVVGVAPGVRLWAVKILDDSGSGLLSWYVCGLDWIAAQRDPLDPSRPMFESVNMSVAKWGKDDLKCGVANKDVLHAAICRLTRSGVTVVAAAGNDLSSAAARVPAAYNEVITVSALADLDGKPGGLGGKKCYSWGTYDVDDTFADFSNRGSDVDIIAPGKCVWSTIPGGYAYMSGTSMAAPHVTGAAALLKASRPGLTTGEVREALLYLGTYNWRYTTDPDAYTDKLLDVSRIGPRGTFSVAAGPAVHLGAAGGAARFPITVTRSTTSFERVRFTVNGLPAGATASFSATSVYGFAAAVSTLTVTFPAHLGAGAYPVTVSADEHGHTKTAVATVNVTVDVPIAKAPVAAAVAKSILGTSTLPTRVSWAAATDASTAIAGYELQTSINGGGWSASTATSGAVRSVSVTQSLGRAYRYRVRARDSVGNWSQWAEGPSVTAALVQDSSTATVYGGTWHRSPQTYASGGTTRYATWAGSRVRTTFSGRSVAIVGPTSSTRGSAALYIDGAYRGTISFRASTTHNRVVIYATTFTTLGTHTIELRLSANHRVDLDTFVILR